MASDKPSKPDVVTYGDHEIITPDTRKLRKLLRPACPAKTTRSPAPRRRWRRSPATSRNGCTTNARGSTPPAARSRSSGLSKQTRQELFLAAHDVKGDSGTLGYPEVAAAADSLCRLLEHTPDLAKIPLAIVDQHVDAVRAIVREHDRPDVAAIAAALTNKLRAVTDEFLVNENRHRPDVLKTIRSPALAPGESF